MSKKTRFIVKISLLAAIVLAACGPEPTPTPVIQAEGLDILPEEVLNPGDILGLLACNFQTGPTSHIAPCADNPGACSPQPDEVIVGLQPSFTWDDPYVCNFDYWELQVVRNDPSFYDYGLQKALFKVLPRATLSYAISTDLQPNTRYKWQIMPSEYMYGVVRSLTKHTAFFWTGPICPPEELEKPSIFAPADGAEINGYWEINLKAAHPGDCGAEIYEYQMGKNVAFAGALVDGFYTSTLPLINGLGDPLDDCSRYYWHVRGLVGTDEGPWSTTRFFTTDFFGDECPTIYDFLPEIPEEFKWPVWPYLPAMVNMNCREGDSMAFRNIGTAFAGELYQILAVNPAATHVRLMLPAINVRCWVFLSGESPWLGALPLDPDELKFWVPELSPFPPTPIPPTPTHEPPQPSPQPECNDGVDNDGDGAIDLQDKDCKDANDDSEEPVRGSSGGG